MGSVIEANATCLPVGCFFAVCLCCRCEAAEGCGGGRGGAGTVGRDGSAEVNHSASRMHGGSSGTTERGSAAETPPANGAPTDGALARRCGARTCTTVDAHHEHRMCALALHTRVTPCSVCENWSQPTRCNLAMKNMSPARARERNTPIAMPTCVFKLNKSLVRLYGRGSNRMSGSVL